MRFLFKPYLRLIAICVGMGSLACLQSSFAQPDSPPPEALRRQAGDEAADIWAAFHKERRQIRSVAVPGRTDRSMFFSETVDGRYATWYDANGPLILIGRHRLQLTLLGFGRHEQLSTLARVPPLQQAPPETPDATGRPYAGQAWDTMVWQHQGITEWTANGASGVRHWFRIPERPQGDGEQVVLEFRARGSLQAMIGEDDTTLHFVVPGRTGNPALTYSGLKAWDANGREVAIHFALTDSHIQMRFDDANAVYPVTIDPVFLNGELVIIDEQEITGAGAGRSLAVQGEFAFIGVPYAYDRSVLDLRGGIVEEVGDAFVVLSNDFTTFTLPIPQVGAVYIIQRSYGRWHRTQTVTESGVTLSAEGPRVVQVLRDPAPLDGGMYGVSVDVDRDKLVVGAPAARVIIDPSDWVVFAEFLEALDPIDLVLGVFGLGDFKVARFMDGEFMAKMAGAAYLYQKQDENGEPRLDEDGEECQMGGWCRVATLTESKKADYDRDSVPLNDDQFGFSVAISGDTVAVGIPGNEDSGAHEAEADTERWINVATFLIENTPAGGIARFARKAKTFKRGSARLSRGRTDLYKKASGSQQAARELQGSISFALDATFVLLDVLEVEFDPIGDLLGADGIPPSKGRVEVFDISDPREPELVHWVSARHLPADQCTPNMRYGHFVDLSTDDSKLLVGAHGARATVDDVQQIGAVFVYEKQGISWASPTATMIRNDQVAGAPYGLVGAWVGDDFALGLPQADKVIFYSKVGDDWSAVQTIDGQEDSLFGAALDGDQDWLMVGAPREAYVLDEGVFRNQNRPWGAAYLYIEDDGRLELSERFSPIHALRNDRRQDFGASVAVDANATIGVGAPFAGHYAGRPNEVGGVYLWTAKTRLHGVIEGARGHGKSFPSGDYIKLKQILTFGSFSTTDVIKRAYPDPESLHNAFVPPEVIRYDVDYSQQPPVRFVSGVAPSGDYHHYVDADGSFEITEAALHSRLELQANTCTAIQYQTPTVTIDALNGETEVIFRAVRKSISGTISAANLPVPNVEVRLTGTEVLIRDVLDSVVSQYTTGTVWTTVTDANGHYQFDNLFPGGDYVVDPQFGSLTVDSQTVTMNGTDVADVDFVGTTHSISGQVLSDGVGVGGVTITGAVFVRGAPFMTLTAQTAGDGSWTLDGVPAGQIDLTASKEGGFFEPTFDGTEVSADTRKAATHTGRIDLDFQELFAVSGTISVLGEGLAGVTVTATDSVDASRSATTDADGFYRLLLPKEDYTIVPAKLADTGGVPWAFAPVSTNISVVAAHIPGQDFGGITYSISGRVLSSFDGRRTPHMTLLLLQGNDDYPAADTTVFYDFNPDATPTAETVDGDAEGFFSITGLHPGQYWLVADPDFWDNVPLSRMDSALSRYLLLGEDQTDYNLKVPSANITGRVYGPDGSPLAGVEIEYIQNEVASSVFTGDDGRYEFGVPAGQLFEWWAKSPDYLFLNDNHDDPGAALDLRQQYPHNNNYSVGGDNDFFAAPYQVVGQVTVGGESIAGVPVLLNGVQRTVTGANGRYVIDDVLAGEHVVEVQVPNITLPARTVRCFPRRSFKRRDLIYNFFSVANIQANFTVGSAPVTGRVSVGDRPIRAEILVDGQLATTSSADGVYVLENLPPGEHSITPRLNALTFTPASSNVTVSVNPITGIDFTTDGHDISGQVTENGVGLPGVDVRLTLDSLSDVEVSLDDSAPEFTTHTVPLAFTALGTVVAIDEIEVDLQSFTYSVGRVSGFVSMSLESPSGTRVTIAEELTGIHRNVLNSELLVPGALDSFVGESVAGTWTLRTFGSNANPVLKLVRLKMSVSQAGLEARDLATTTDNDGMYQFTDLTVGDWTVTPQLDGLAFDPVSQTVTTNADVTDVDFAVDLPTVSALNLSTDAGYPLSITLAGQSPGGGPLSYSVSDPSDGTLSDVSEDTVVYTPPAGFSGQATFTYQAAVDAIISAPATVTITVNPIHVSSIQGGANDVRVGATVYVDEPAPPGGLLVNLSDDSAAFDVPATVTVAHGQDNAYFTAPLGGVDNTGTATITATRHGQSVQLPLDLKKSRFTVSGTVRLDGLGIGDIELRLRKTSEQSFQARVVTTGPDGSYTFTDERAGNYVLTVSDAMVPFGHELDQATHYFRLNTADASIDFAMEAKSYVLDRGRFMELLGDGSDEFVQLPVASTLFDDSNGWTFECWVNLRSAPANGASLMHFYNTDSDCHVRLGFDAASAVAVIETELAGVPMTVAAPSACPTGVWIHVAGTIAVDPENPGQAIGKLFLMGSEVASGPLHEPPAGDWDDNTLGKNLVSNALLDAWLDEVRCWRLARHVAALQSLIFSEDITPATAPTAALWARYRFDAVDGATIVDTADEGRHGAWNVADGKVRTNSTIAKALEQSPVRLQLAAACVDMQPVALTTAPLNNVGTFTDLGGGLIEVTPNVPQGNTTVRASTATDSRTATIAVNQMSLQAPLLFDPQLPFSGETVMGTIRTTQPAPVGGRSITLETASATDHNFTFPASVQIPEGETEATFSVDTEASDDPQRLEINASYLGSTVTGVLELEPSLSVITGRVSSRSGRGFPDGVEMRLTGPGIDETRVLPSVGVVVFHDLPLGTYTLTPSSPGIVFDPASGVVEITEIDSYGWRFDMVVPDIQSVSFTPAQPVSGDVVTGTVQFEGVIPPGDFELFFLDLSGYGATVPARIPLVSGQSQATFTMGTTPYGGDYDIPVRMLTESSEFEQTLSVQAATRSIFGRVTTGGQGLAGITVKAENVNTSEISTAVTRSDGSYVIPDVAATSYNVFPEATGLTFVPQTRLAQLFSGNTLESVLDVDFNVPWPTLDSFNLSPNPVVGGQESIGTVQLSSAAPNGGVTVTIDIDDNRISVPESVTIPQGTSQVSFAIQPPAVLTEETHPVSISFDGNTNTVDLTVQPQPVSISGVVGNQGAGYENVTMSLLSGGLTIAQTVTDATGSYQFTDRLPGNYQVVPDGDTVAITPTELLVSLTFESVSGVDFATSAPTLDAFFTPLERLNSGDGVQLIIGLDGVARPGGETIQLSSSDTSALTVPAQINIPEGGAVLVHDLTAGNVLEDTEVTVTATHGGISRTTDLLIAPASNLEISGTVTRNGNPLEGLQVLALRPGVPGWQHDVVTDANGDYVLDRLPPGPVDVYTELADELVEPARQRIELVQNNVTGVDFAILEPELIELSLEQIAPLQTFSGEYEPGTELVYRVTLADVPPDALGDVTVTLSATDGAPLGYALFNSQEAPLPLPAALTFSPTLAAEQLISITLNEVEQETAVTLKATLNGIELEHDFAVIPTVRTISGRITKSGVGFPASVGFTSPSTTEPLFVPSDASGNYTFSTRLREVWTVGPQSESTPATQMADLTVGSVADVDFELHRSERLQRFEWRDPNTSEQVGSVVGGDSYQLFAELPNWLPIGQPALVISLTSSDPSIAPVPATMAVARRTGFLVQTPAVTEEHLVTITGEYLATSLTEREQQQRFGFRGWPPLTASLLVTPPSFEVSGTILSHGVPMRYVQVTLTGSSGQTLTTGTDQAGRYEFLAYPGTLTITPQTTTGSFAPANSVVELVDQDIAGGDFAGTAGPMASMRLHRNRVRGGDSLLVECTLVNPPDNNIRVPISSSDTDKIADGFVDFGLGNPISAVLLISSPVIGEEVVTLSTPGDGADVTLDVTLTEEAPNVVGTFTRASGSALGLLPISVRLTDGGTFDKTSGVDDEGRYQFDDVPAGDYTVTPTLTGYTFDVASQNVTMATNTVTADFVLQDPVVDALTLHGQGLTDQTAGGTEEVEGGDSITGTVTIQNAAPLGGALIQLLTDLPSVVLPAQVTIPEGQTELTFDIHTREISTVEDDLVRARTGNVVVSDALRVYPPPTSISGVLTRNEEPVPNRSVHLGAAEVIVMTDDDGRYAFTNLWANPQNIVVPPIGGENIQPANHAVDITTSDPVVDKDFSIDSAALIDFQLDVASVTSGNSLTATATLAGGPDHDQLIHLSASMPNLVTFPEAPRVISPTQVAVNFTIDTHSTPTAQDVTISARSGGVTIQQTLSLTPSYTITGAVTASGDPMPHVPIETTGTDARSDDDGDYTLSRLSPAAYTVAPVTSPFGVFTPADRQVTVVDADIPDRDFAFAPKPIALNLGRFMRFAGGAEDHFELPNTEELDDAWTVECWFRADDPHMDAALLDLAHSPSVSQIRLGFDGTTGRLMVGTYQSIALSRELRAPNDMVIPADAWVHVAATFAPTDPGVGIGRLFVQGREVASGELLDLPVDVDGRPESYVGKSNNGGPNFTGVIDEVRFWQTARTASDINGSMLDTFPNGATDLLMNFNANWDFNGTQLFSQSTIAYHGNWANAAGPDVENSSIIERPDLSTPMTIELAGATWDFQPVTFQIVEAPDEGTFNGPLDEGTSRFEFLPNGLDAAESIEFTVHAGADSSDVAEVDITRPPQQLLSLTVAPNPLRSGEPATATVTLSGEPENFDVVLIAEAPGGGLNVPFHVTVPSGESSGTFPVLGLLASGFETRHLAVTHNNVTITTQVGVAGLSAVADPTALDRGRFLQLGDNEHIDLPDAADIADAISLECWVHPQAQQGGFGEKPLIDLADGAGQDRVFFALQDNRPFLLVSREGNFSVLMVESTSLTIPDDRWVHFAATVTPSAARSTMGTAAIYVNGLLVAEGDINCPRAVARPDSALATNTVFPTYHSGYLDEVRIWNNSRSAAEISADMYTTYPPGFPDLWAQYSMDEVDGQTVTDSSGNGRDGQLMPGGKTRLQSTLVETNPVAPTDPVDVCLAGLTPGLEAVTFQILGEPAGIEVTDADPNDCVVTVERDAGFTGGTSFDFVAVHSGVTSEAQTVTIVGANQAPDFDVGADITVDEDSGLFSELNWADNIDAGGDAEANQTVTFTLTPDDPDLFATGPGIDADGTLSFTPAQNAFGTTMVTILAQDDGGTDFGGQDSVMKTFSITITSVNDVPSLVLPAAGALQEGGAAQLMIGAVDGDLPADQLTFELLLGPTGATIDPNNGMVSWTPNESRGGVAQVLSVRVTDAVGATDVQQLTLMVDEVNDAPALEQIPGQAVIFGNQLSFTASGMDTDFPANALTYSIDSGPPGSEIDPQTGVFSWTPPTNYGDGEIETTVTVTDNGTPARQASRTFTIDVSFILELKEGWNLIAMPIQPDDPAVSSIFRINGDPNRVLRVLGWQGGSYFSVDTVEPWQAYWVFSPVPLAIPVDGDAPASTDVALADGWNMVGQPAGSLLGDNRPVWRWDGKRMRKVTDFEQWRGYWLRK